MADSSWLWSRSSSKSLLPITTPQIETTDSESSWSIWGEKPQVEEKPSPTNQKDPVLEAALEKHDQNLTMYSFPSYLTSTKVQASGSGGSPMLERKSSLLEGYDQTADKMAKSSNLSLVPPKKNHHTQAFGNNPNVPVPIPPSRKFHLTGRLYGYLERQTVINGKLMVDLQKKVGGLKFAFVNLFYSSQFFSGLIEYFSKTLSSDKQMNLV